MPSDDDWEFEFDRTEDIREADECPGIRVHLRAVYPPTAEPLTIDVTTGDKITPGPMEYEYPLLFGEGSVSLVAYPLETVLAEKPGTLARERPAVGPWPDGTALTPNVRAGPRKFGRDHESSDMTPNVRTGRRAPGGATG